MEISDLNSSRSAFGESIRYYKRMVEENQTQLSKYRKRIQNLQQELEGVRVQKETQAAEIEYIRKELADSIKPEEVCFVLTCLMAGFSVVV